MGVIQRQGFKSSIVQYVGVAIGAYSSIFIYTLDYAAYGLAQTLLDLVIFLTPVVTFGATNLVLKFFPDFRLRNGGERGYLGFLLLLVAVGLLISGFLFWTVGDWLSGGLEWLGFDLSLFRAYQWPILIFLVIYVLIQLFDSYIRTYNRIAIQSVLTSLLPKIGLPLLILLLFFQYIEQVAFVYGVVAVYGLALIGLVVYAWRITPFDLRIDTEVLRPSLRREMRTFAAYSVFGTMGGILATQMDSLMISTLIDTSSTGVYKVVAFMAVVIEIPARSVKAIASPIIADAWKKKEIDRIAGIYTRSSAVLGFLGSALFVLVAINIKDIVSWTRNPAEILANLGVFYLLGAVRLIDLYTGVNNQIITYSDYYRFNIVAVLILAVLNLTFNYLLIVHLGWGLVGVALSTFIAIFLYNAAKFLFLYFKLGLHPFSGETLRILVTFALAFCLILLPVDTGWSLVNVALRSLPVTLIFWVSLRYWKVCPEILAALRKYWQQLLDRLKLT